MKKTILATICFCSLLNVTFTQGLNWAFDIGGEASILEDDEGKDIVLDSNGDVYTIGSFQGTADFNPDNTVANTSTAVGEKDIFIAKYDANGNYIWSFGLGSTDDDEGFSIAVDHASNVYVAGYFTNTVDFDPNPNTTSVLTAVGDADIFIAKYDNSGNYIWAFNLGSAGTDRANGITVDAAANVYVTGLFTNTIDFDPHPNTTNILTAVGQDDIFIAKYDSDGNHVWAFDLGDQRVDQGNSIVTDGTSNIYVTGLFRNTIDFDPSINAVNELTSAGSRDIFIAKYDTDGNYIWAIGIGGTSGDEGFDIALDNASNVYATGYFRATVDFDPDEIATNIFTTAGSRETFIAKYDPDGKHVWAFGLAGTGLDEGKGIAVDNASNVYVTGGFLNTIDFNPSSNTSNSLTASGANSPDIFVAKYNTNGAYLSAFNITGDAAEGEAIAVNDNGQAFVIGNFGGVNVDFNQDGSTINTLSTSGDRDQNCFVARFFSTTLVPVELLYFKGQSTAHGNDLFWQTVSELHNKGFEVQKSSNSKVWQPIGFVKGNGTTIAKQHYEYTDPNPIRGVNYYRLKQINFNETYEYSHVIAVHDASSAKRETLSVFPNPTTAQLYYRVASMNQVQSVQLFDIYGKLVKVVPHVNGQLTLADLNTGVYVLVVKTRQAQLQQVVVLR